MKERILPHPLAEMHDARPETDNEETINSWAFASMIAHVSSGRMEGDRLTAVGMAKDCIQKVSPLYDCSRLIEDAKTDEGLMRLINVINEGIEKKCVEAFNKEG